MKDFIDDFEEETDIAEEQLEVPEEALEPGNRRGPRRQYGRRPWTRRKPIIAEVVQVPATEENTENERTDGVSAPAETEEVLEDVVFSDNGHAAPVTAKFQKPMTYGSVDG
jgi:hypothetical protein